MLLLISLYNNFRCNTDLGDNDIEMTIVRGVQFNPPSGYSEKDLDTYIKFEFPFPTVSKNGSYF